MVAAARSAPAFRTSSGSTPSTCNIPVERRSPGTIHRGRLPKLPQADGRGHSPCVADCPESRARRSRIRSRVPSGGRPSITLSVSVTARIVSIRHSSSRSIARCFLQRRSFTEVLHGRIIPFFLAAATSGETTVIGSVTPSRVAFRDDRTNIEAPDSWTSTGTGPRSKQCSGPSPRAARWSSAATW